MDKVVSVKEYLMHKLEPREDVLSPVISKVMSPKRASSDMGVRASALKNATLSYFTILKSYFINYTISFYNTPYIQKLYYFTFSLK